MLSSQTWSQLADLLKHEKGPYIVSSPRLLKEQCAAGDYSFVGNGLLSVRLDLALAGLMAELGEDFFHSDIFPSRLTAAMDILAAARVFLLQPDILEPESGQAHRVRLLAEEACDVLNTWALAAERESEQTLLMAAEEAAELF